MSNYPNPLIQFAGAVGAGGFEHADPVLPTAPLFRVTAGHPSDEELAALAAVVLSLQSEAIDAPAPRHNRAWARRRQLRLQPTPGPGAWRRSMR